MRIEPTLHLLDRAAIAVVRVTPVQRSMKKGVWVHGQRVKVPARSCQIHAFQELDIVERERAAEYRRSRVRAVDCAVRPSQQVGIFRRTWSRGPEGELI